MYHCPKESSVNPAEGRITLGTPANAWSASDDLSRVTNLVMEVVTDWRKESRHSAMFEMSSTKRF